MDGREVIRVLRASPETNRLALIAISAVKIATTDIVRGLDEGADEYLPKPLDIDLLLVRIGNLIERGRNRGATGREVISWGPIKIAPDEHSVSLSGRAINLTNLEMKLLLAFLRQSGRVLPRSLLLQTVWNSSPDVTTRTVDKHVESLRRKLPPFGKKVETVVGVGYMFRP
jgi:DNA-binding response OmpR family regulator